MSPMSNTSGRGQDLRALLMVITERVGNLQEDMRELKGSMAHLSEVISHIEDMERRLASLEDWQEWAQRIILGAIIMAVIGLVLGGAGAAGIAHQITGR